MNVTWNPDAVAPPLGDVYAREREMASHLLVLAKVFLAGGIGFAALAASLTFIGAFA